MPLIKLTVNRRVTVLYKVRSLKSFSKRWTEVCHSPGKHVQMFLHKITKLFNISSSTIWSSEILKESLCARDKIKNNIVFFGLSDRFRNRKDFTLRTVPCIGSETLTEIITFEDNSPTCYPKPASRIIWTYAPIHMMSSSLEVLHISVRLHLLERDDFRVEESRFQMKTFEKS